MTSFLRPLAYRYRWIYDTVTAVSSLSVGGVERLRGLGLMAVQPHLKPGAAVLDLCCGSGEAAAPWLAAGYAVTGLDVSPAPWIWRPNATPAWSGWKGWPKIRPWPMPASAPSS